MKNLLNFGWMALLPLLVSCTTDEVPKPDETSSFPCFINSNYNLNNQRPGVDYEVNCMVVISGGTFTIDPGVEVVFGPNGGFQFTDNARINIVGNDSMPIVLKGKDGGAWWGLQVSSNNILNKISYTEIVRAGIQSTFNSTVAGYFYDEKTSIAVTGKIGLDHVSIIRSEGAGISVATEAELTTFNKVSVSEAKLHPVLMYASHADAIIFDSCEFISNGLQKILLFSTSSNAVVEEDYVLKSAPIPYLAISDLNMSGNVVFEAGVTLEVKPGLGLSVEQGGRWRINGNSSEPVLIKGEQNVRGIWKGILVNSFNTNEFNYLQISDGGSEAYFIAEKTNIAIGSVAKASLTINNCKSTNYAGNCAVAYSTTDGTLVNNSPDITDVCTY